MTRRLLTAVVVLGLVFGGVGSAEAKPTGRSTRTIYGRYGPYPSPVTGCNDPLGPWACMIVRARLAERFVSVKVTDAHGLPVYFSMLDPGTGYFAGFCGETGPLPLDEIRYLEIEVGVSRMVLQTDCPASSIKTTGTIKVTLSSER